MPSLLDPLQIGSHTLANRIVVSPMTRARAKPDGIPLDNLGVYYANRATAGLVITGSCRVSAMGSGIGHDPGMHNKAQIAGWKRQIGMIKDAGGIVFLQLYYGGGQAHPFVLPGFAQPVGPSAINVGGSCRTPYGFMPRVTTRALALNEIEQIIGEFASAARAAVEVGCDGVEVHSCSGYLLEEFMCSGSNRRTDRYGGSIANRCRFTLEIVDAVQRAVPANVAVGVKLSPYYNVNDSNVVVDDDPEAMFSHMVRALSDRRIAYLQVAVEKPGVIDYHELLRPQFKGPYIAGGCFTPESAADAVATGKADAITFGRLYITNPDLVHRIRTGMAVIPTERGTTFAYGPRGFAEYLEAEMPPFLPAPPMPVFAATGD